MDEKDYKLSPEDRKLLAKDLYQRLGTNTLVQDMKCIKTNRPNPIWLVDTIMEEVRLFADEPWIPIDTVRPYLRSLSSMTEEEAMEVVELCVCSRKDVLSVSVKQDYISVEIDDLVADSETYTIWFNEIVTSIELLDWLVDNKFDYRGLIPMGLALEAPKAMYNI